MSDPKENIKMVDKAWGKMSDLLDKELPEDNRRTPVFWWFLGTLVALVLTAWLYIELSDKSNSAQIDKSQHQHPITVIDEAIKEPVTQEEERTLTKSSMPTSKSYSDGTEGPQERAISYLEEADYVSIPSNEPNRSVLSQSPEDDQTLQTSYTANDFEQMSSASSDVLPSQSIQMLPSLSFTLPLTNAFPLEKESPLADIPSLGEQFASHQFFLALDGMTDFRQNLSAGLNFGYEQKLSNSWSTTYAVGVHWSRVSPGRLFAKSSDTISRSTFSNQDFQFVDLASQEWSGDNIGTWELKFGTIDQYIISYQQGLKYHFSGNSANSRWSLGLRGLLGYVLTNKADPLVTLHYREPASGGSPSNVELRYIKGNDLQEFTSNVMYGLNLELYYRIHRNIELRGGLGTLMSLQPKRDIFLLDKKRDLNFVMGVAIGL